MPWTAPATEPASDPALTRVFAGCLPGGRLSGPLLAFASVASTQGICRVLAAEGAPEGTVVLADHQTAGRGRRGRAWTAPPGTALLFSCVLRPPLDSSRWPELTLTAGCAVAEAVESTAGVAVRLKWPNDVLVDHRKVAGILAEGVLGEDPFVVLGIGVNVLQRGADWPPDLSSRAVSLAAVGSAVGREALLAAILAGSLSRSRDGPATAEQAGRAWGRYLVERPLPLATLTPEDAAEQVVRLLDEHGFEPERENGDVVMRRCPFRDLAEQHGEVVCSVHLGLIRGALDEIGAPVTATRLEPFVEPGLCRARLGRA